ncbi:MAG: TonB-dependent receptor, partial [Bacteroidota bacterium]
DILYFDWSLFYLRYNQRIGFLLLANRPPLFLDFRFQTNIGDSRHYGLESLTELSLSRLFFRRKTKAELRWYTNFSWIDARYVQVADRSIDGNKVEYVPEFLLRTGLNFSWKGLKASYQFSYLGEQFTDATNAIGPVSGAVSGLIPSYFVMDLSLSYEYTFLKLSTGVNNLTDERYFTRRAESYPGPGIIPAAGRNFYVSLRGQF